MMMSAPDKEEAKMVVDPHPDAAAAPDKEGSDEEVGVVTKGAKLHTDLRGRHMQMIAIGRLPFPLLHGGADAQASPAMRRGTSY